MKIHENEKCPVCDKIFTDDDDIVICPYCGTPHHRDCYNALGKCVNEDKHSQGFEYKYEENESSSHSTENDAQRLNPNNNYYVPKTEETGKTLCKNCGKEIDSGVPFCSYCGEKQDNPQYRPSTPFNSRLNDAQHEAYKNSKETIDGKSLSDVAAVVGVNSQKFIPKFKKNKKISWNWGGFIFGPFYLLYRKMYKEGIITLVLRTVVSFFIQGMFPQEVSEYNSFMSAVMQDPTAYANSANPTAMITDLFDKAPTVLTALFITKLVINIFVALFSNYFYRKKVIDVLNKVDENVEKGGIFSQSMPFAMEQPSLSQEEMKKIYLSRMGGVSFFIPLVAYFALDLVLNIISML